MILKTVHKSREKYVDRIIDLTDKSLFIRFLRYCIKFHPLFYARFQFATGNIRLAKKLIEKHHLEKNFGKQLTDLILNVDQVLHHGSYKIPQKETNPCTPWNNKVLFALNKSFPYDSPGYSIRSHMILKHLKHSGLDATAATRLDYPWIIPEHVNKPVCSEDIVDGITYKRLRSDQNLWDQNLLGIYYINAYAYKLAETAKSHNVSVLHSASNFLTGLAGAQAAGIAGCKSIYEMRGLWHLSRKIAEPGFSTRDECKYNEIMEISAAAESDAVVTLSEAMKNWLIDQGIQEDKITVVPNAVDISLFTPQPKDQTLKQQLGLEGKTVVGFVGSVTDYEGLDMLIQAVSRLADQGANICLLIVGHGYAEKNLKELALSIPGGKNIHFAGFVPFQEIKKYYSIMDILPCPRNNFEVCRIVPPLKILESMAMEKPVIVSDLPPLLEMVKDGYNGYVCRADDVSSLAEILDRLHKNPEHGKVIGKQARKWVIEKRSWKNNAKKYIKLYQSLCTIQIKEIIEQ